ncbi:MAG TPA: DUF4214 domain-containing protein, partial [Acidimicrobiales bacterium]
ALSNSAYVTAIYNNVFDRAPDAGGQTYWTSQIDHGTSRSDVLVQFAQSTEYRNGTQARTQFISSWFAMLRRVPTSSEITARLPLAVDLLLNYLRNTYSYAARF